MVKSDSDGDTFPQPVVVGRLVADHPGRLLQLQSLARSQLIVEVVPQLLQRERLIEGC